MKFYFVWNVGNSRWDDDVFFFLLLLCRVLKKHRFEKIEKKRRNWRIKFPSGGVVNFSDVDSEWFWKVLIINQTKIRFCLHQIIGLKACIVWEKSPWQEILRIVIRYTHKWISFWLCPRNLLLNKRTQIEKLRER